jgi:catechol 2,3-dioxygenase-like lactoylglutathione lyase family enzyme
LATISGGKQGDGFIQQGDVVLRVADLGKAVDWYTRVLGFSVCWRAANDGGGENCMLAARNTAVMPQGNPWETSRRLPGRFILR